MGTAVVWEAASGERLQTLSHEGYGSRRGVERGRGPDFDLERGRNG